MFLYTLSISERVVSTVSQKLMISPMIPLEQRNIILDLIEFREIKLDCMKEHISMFPSVDSHYRRADSKKQCWESDLSISKMHRLYIEWVKDKTACVKAKSATLRQYTDIFNTFNLSFYKPKKDLCDKCEQFKLASAEEKLILQSEHENLI